MKKFTTTSQNWSGALLTFKASAKKLLVGDHSFDIEYKAADIIGYEQAVFTCDGTILSAGRFEGDKLWMSISGSIVREAATPQEAVAQLYANLF
jgi:hypothetical protein